MPADRTVGAQYAQSIIDLYAEVERDIAIVIAAKVKKGMAHEDLSAKLAALTEVRRAAEAAMRKIDGKLAPAVRRALHAAAVAGARSAQVDLLKVRDARAVGRRVGELDRNLINSPSILRLAATLAPALERRLASTHLQVVRSAGDIYQKAVAAQSAPGVLAGVLTRREASQKALDHLWEKGITGFVDKAGRNWNLASYVEMATRTTVAQASIQAHLDQLRQNGQNLVQVSSDGAPCPICRPWEGKVLTVDSSGHSTDPNVTVSGTVDQAIGAGLFHPSCRHRLITFLPGITPPLTPEPGSDQVYADEQRQRALERDARRLAARQAGAIDATAAKEAGAAYRAKRAEIKAFVDAHPQLRRKTERERVDLGHTATPGFKPAEVVKSTKAPVKALPKKAPAAKSTPSKAVPRKSPTPAKAIQPTRAARPKPVKAPTPPATPTVLSRGELNGIYGSHLSVKLGVDPAQLASHMKELGTIARRAHESVASMFHHSQESNPGIHIGPGAVPDITPEMAHLKSVQPRGWSAGKTWNDVAGAFSPSEEQLIIGDENQHKHGSHSLAAHEFGHAFDFAQTTGRPSNSTVFREAYEKIAKGRMKSYFNTATNPGYHQEFFAETFAVYSLNRHLPRGEIARKILGATTLWDGSMLDQVSAIVDKDWNVYTTVINKEIGQGMIELIDLLERLTR